MTTTEAENILLARVERLLKAFPPAVRSRFLPRVLEQLPGDDVPFGKMDPRALATRILFPSAPVATNKADEPKKTTTAVTTKAAAGATPAPSVDKAAVPESIKAKLLRTGGARLTALSQAVSAETVHTTEKIVELVLKRVDALLAKAGEEALECVTPGAASGKYWAPGGTRGTAGSAAYARYKNKYNRLGYKTLIPLYFDERACKSEDVWLRRKDLARDIEKAVHRHLAKHPLYRGNEGGGEPGYSNTTHFYVYLAIK